MDGLLAPVAPVAAGSCNVLERQVGFAPSVGRSWSAWVGIEKSSFAGMLRVGERGHSSLTVGAVAGGADAADVAADVVEAVVVVMRR